MDARNRLEKLQRLLDDAGVVHFTAHEFCGLYRDEWPGPNIYPPPKRMLSNIVPTAVIADRLREEWGGPVKCDSGYRPPYYNWEIVGGSSDSQHMYFRALDLRPANAEYGRWWAHCKMVVRRLREQGQIIGFGLYDTFCHIDTGYYDYNRDWDRRSDA